MASLIRRRSSAASDLSFEPTNQSISSPSASQQVLQSYSDWRARLQGARLPLSRDQTYANYHSRVARQDVDYWSRLLKDFPPAYFDSAPDALTSHPPIQEHSTRLEDAQLFHRTCASSGINASTLIQAAWALTLGAHLSTRDVCFAYKPPARDVPIVGPFLKTLYRRVALDDKEPCRRFLRKIHHSYVEAVSHQRCSASDVEKALGGQVYCNSFLAVDLSGTNKHASQSLEQSTYDIALLVSIDREDVSMKTLYRPSLSSATVQSIIESFSEALFGLLVSPMIKVGSISLIRNVGLSPVFDSPIKPRDTQFPRSSKPFSMSSLRKAELARICDLDEASLEDAYPTTALQQGLMTITTRHPDAFTTHDVYRLSDRIDQTRLQQAIEAIAREYVILRSRLVQASSEDVLQVVVKGSLPWTYFSSLEQYHQHDRSQPMAYGTPLWRFAIVNDADTKAAYLCWTAHHAAYDGWAENLIIASFRSAYESSTFDAPRPFADFIGYLKEQHQTESENYWANQLAGNSPTPFPSLPGGMYEPRVDQRIMRRVELTIPEHSRVLPSSFLRAAWALTLSQYSDSDDIIFASTLSGRQAPLDGIEAVAGPTITTVPLRIAIDRNSSVVDFLGKMHSDALDMIPHEHFGLQNISRISADVRKNMILNSYFLVQPSNPEGENPDAKALGLERVAGSGEDFSADAYPLNVQCHLDGSHVIIDCTFDDNILERAQTELMVRQFEHVIALLGRAPSAMKLSDMPMVSELERQTMLKLNGPYIKTLARCVHEVIEDRAAEHPEAEAICSFDGVMSYGELNDRADQLATKLVGLGVGPEVPVPICMEKGVWVIVTMLAVLKAGGVVVCFTASQPKERLAGLIRSLDATLMVADPQHLHLFEALLPTLLPASSDLFADSPEKVSKSKHSFAQPNNAAFIVFTSGSTGTPKGIVTEHQSICTSSLAHGTAMGIERGQRVLQYSSFTYDVYIQDIFTSLQKGATVCVVSEEERYNDLGSAIRRTGATWADLTSTVAALLEPESVPTLKTISLGGEPMKPEVASKWEPRPGMQVINVFGPAEASVTSTLSTIAQRKGQASNIGPPVGCWAWVVDPANRNLLKPIGTTGELMLHGPILARHYLNDPGKTAASFLNNLDWMPALRPECDDYQSQRAYATGDLVKMQPDGTLLYIGRADNQVKINGQRVELGEIENTLSRLSGSSTKTACELVSATGRKVLTAFISSDDFKELPVEGATQVITLTESLKRAIAEVSEQARLALPSHMVPSLYIPMRNLPMSPSGKLDRKVLKAISGALPLDVLNRYAPAHTEVVVPETPRQFLLRSIWSSLLKLNEGTIGADTDFFAIGADSISAMQLVPKAQAHGLDISVANIMNHSRLRDMASVIAEIRVDAPKNLENFALCPVANIQTLIEEASEQCSILRACVEDIYPSTKLQEGLLALTAIDPDAYVNRMMFKLPESLEVDAFKTAWNIVFQHHSILRSRLFLSNSIERYMQVVVKEDIPWIQHSDDLATYIEQDEATVFSAGQPLTRFALVSRQEEHFFVLTMHHAAYDGHSVGLLFEDLLNAYQGQKLLNLGDFRPFVSFLENQSQAEQEKYWQDQLGDGGTSTWPLTQNQVSKGAQGITRRHIPTTQAQRVGTRTALLFRAAWVLTTSQYANSEDVTMAVTLSGRDMPVPRALEVTGPLLTTVPLRVRYSQSQTVGEFLNQIEAQATGMINFQHYGLQNIISMQRQRGASLSLNQLFLVQPGGADDDGMMNNMGLEPLEANSGNFETYPLNVEVKLGDRESTIEAVHDLSYIDSKFMDRIMDQYCHMVQILHSAASTARLGDLDIVNVEDRKWIDSLNDRLPERVCECVHERVAQHVSRQPQAQAVSSYDQDWTYAELDEAAEVLANRLRQLGVGPGEMVPLCFDKSSWAIVAMYAVLKAGGACTSVAASYPRDRLSLIVSDTEARVALCSPQHTHLFYDLRADGLVPAVLGLDSSLIEDCKKDALCPVDSKPVHTDPAFVVYTSGSTGRPKGVIVEHGASRSSADAHGPAFGFNNNSRVAQFAAYTFDVSIQDIFTTLSVGGTVCVVSEEERMSDLAGAITRRNANWMEMTPTVANLLSPQEVPSLKTLSLGGEILTEQALSKWYTKDIRLLNTYGPTECSINSTWAVIDNVKFNVSNIGKPVGCVLWVAAADDHQRLVPVGCVGEMLIEGPILAREYLNDPIKTNAAFVSGMQWLPADTQSQARRFYKTGDLVRYRPDGGVDYLGRKDQQVKLNGLRIELGEIEAQTEKASNSVKSAAVDLVQPRVRGSVKSLATFINLDMNVASKPTRLLKLNDDLQAKFETIRRHLETAVPTYMVPSLFFPVSELPMSASGKLDRKLLRSLADNLSEQELIVYGLDFSPSDQWQDLSAEQNDGDADPNEVASKIVEIASRVLKVQPEKINTRLSWVSAGGDSISAMMFASKCRAEGVNVTVATLLKSRSLLDVVRSVPRRAIPGTTATKDIFERNMPLTPAQRMFFDQLYVSSGGDAHYNQSWYGKFQRKVSTESILEAFRLLLATHPVLRSHFLQEQGVWKQRIPKAASDDFANALKVKDINHLNDVVSKRHSTTIDFQNGPIFTADVLELPAGEQYVCMIAHHLVVDVVSWQIIIDDLTSLLTDQTTIEKEPLLFPAWAELQLEKAQAPELQPENAGAPPARSLDRSFWGIDSSATLTGRSVMSHTITIDPKATSLLLGPANNAMGTETVDLLLAAVSHAFLQTFPERDHLTIFNEGHGRETWSTDIDLTRTIGWFTTIFPVSVFRSSGHDLKSVVRQVKDGRKALASNGWAYFASRYLNPKGIAEAKMEDPMMEVEFNWHGNQQEDFSEETLLEEATLDVIPDQGADVPAQVLFDIGALVQDTGELEILFQYQGALHRQAEIRAWAQAIEHSLYDVADSMASMPASWTLHDFPLLRTDYAGLDKLQDSIVPSIGLLAKNNIEDVYPCTPMQDGILLSQVRGPGSYETESIFEIRCTGAEMTADAARLSKAWQHLISRHSSLRSIFIDSVGHTSAYDQVVLKTYQGPVVFCESDCAENALGEIQNISTVDYRQMRPPHRLTICTIPEGKLVCRIEASHTITDGYSGDIFENDLNEAYWNDSLTSIGPVYRNFVEHVYKSSAADKLDYWRSYLHGLEPTIFPRLAYEPNQSAIAGNLVKTLSDELSAAARLYCENNGVTVATLVQTAWAAVLRLYTGSDKVCFGYLASGRDTPVDHVENAIGAYMNMLVCRTDFEHERSVAEVVKHVHERSLQSLSYQHLALADIQHELGFTNQAIFNTIMSFQKAGKVDQQEPTEAKQSLVFDEVAAKDPTEYDIALDVGADDESIEVSMDFSTQCLSTRQAARILASFEQAVTEIVSEDALRVADFWSVSPSELGALAEWNGPFPPSLQSCIHTNFEDHARQHPNTSAITSFDVNLSYSELNTLADMLASHLYSLDVKPGVIVPLCFPKTTWAAVAQLAVLKTGASCASLNPEHPVPRLSSLIEEVNGPLVLCSESSAPIFTETVHQVIAVSEQLMGSLQISTSIPIEVRPSDTAFVVFTSGSTGKPKGVALSHSALTTSASAHGSAMSIGPSSRVLQYAAYTYDVSVQDLWTTLQRGGTTCVISEEERLDVDLLIDAINSHAVNWADLTPTVAGLINPAKVPTLTTISLGGEAVPRSVIETWERAGRRVINGYGPAEASINCACSDKEQRHGDAANIGRPLASWFWLTRPEDPNRLAPIGTVGELLVESPQLSDGYLNDESKTNAAFITDPAWVKQVPSAGSPQIRRMYRTGDMVRLTDEGTYIFVGRSDRQIKIRGQRVELGEVEHQVQNTAPAGAAVLIDVVETVKNEQKKTEIAAFFDLSANHDLDQDDVSALLVASNAAIEEQLTKTRDTVSTRLPKHMVPTLYVPLRKFPVNASGKLDSKQLRDLLHDVSATERKRFALALAVKQSPRTSEEKELHRIFSEVFSLADDEVGIHDSFLGLGGDSIVAMRVVKEARRAGLDLTVPDVLQYPQLDKLAGLVRDKSRASSDLESTYEPLSLVVASAAGRAAFIQNYIAPKCPLVGEGCSNVLDVHPVTDVQTGFARANMNETRDWLVYFTWTGDSSVNIARLKRSLHETMNTFDSLRSVFVEHDGAVLQVVLKQVPDAEVQLQFTDKPLSEAMEDLQADDMGRPVAWGQPLAQCAIVQHAGQDTQGSELTVVLRMTHAQYDGMSMHYMVDFFKQRYNGAPSLTDGEPRLSQGQYLSRVKDDALRLDSLAYWRNLLRGARNTNVCAHDPYPAERGTSDEELHVKTTISAAQLQSTRFTLSNIVKASWMRVLADVTGDADVVFGDLTTGRNTWGAAERVDGCTFHRVPVRLDVSRYATISALVQALAAQSAASMPHENLGWFSIAEACAEWPAAADTGSLVQHTNMDNEHDEVIELGGVSMRHGVFDQGGSAGDCVTLETEMLHGGETLEVSIFWKDRLMSRRFADEVVQRLRGYMLAVCAEE